MKIEKYLRASPTFTIILNAQKITTILEQFLKQEGLSYLKALILISIFFEKDKQVRPKTLAKVFETTKGNVSHSLAKLEELKLITRKPVSGDIRGAIIELSPKGTALTKKLVKYFDSLQTNIEDKMSEEVVMDFNKKIELIHELH